MHLDSVDLLIPERSDFLQNGLCALHKLFWIGEIEKVPGCFCIQMVGNVSPYGKALSCRRQDNLSTEDKLKRCREVGKYHRPQHN